jgi:hypothetical protein
MRRRLYEFFGLPSLPDSPEEEPLEAELPEEEDVVEISPPIHIPKPVRPVERTPVHEMVFHDLGEKRWLEWATSRQGLPQRGLRYVRPDQMHRLPLDGIAARLNQGDIHIVDLASLAHMDSQRAALARQVQDVANHVGLPVFSLDDDQRILLIPGRGSKVDTETHELGGSSILS